ncbi:sigma-70 family RNA polymerase sigma factor [Kitasatospora sp. NPDC058046]|uniref:sigma-70 family RNA polymerase sigma factor n=1 Tax=Kitasatospora sp. NPDC058046 TaxID=3346312 RepID=UPI0036DCF659
MASTTPPPEPFAVLADLVAGGATMHTAAQLGEALNAVPQLQRWLREQRRSVLQELKATHSNGEIGSRLGLTAQRVADIAAGHSHTRATRAARA